MADGLAEVVIRTSISFYVELIFSSFVFFFSID